MVRWDLPEEAKFNNYSEFEAWMGLGTAEKNYTLAIKDISLMRRLESGKIADTR